MSVFGEFCDLMDQYGASGIPFIFAVDYKCLKPLIWKAGEVPPDVSYNFGGFSNCSDDDNTGMAAAGFLKHPLSFECYEKSFSLVKKNIGRGESFLVNLSAPTPVETELSFPEIFARSRARYRFRLADEFVCFSPETFVKIRDGIIATNPMKGTIDAGMPGAAQLVLDNPKEAAEHATIVDLLRNDLSRVAEKVWVERYRYLDTIRTSDKTLLQVSSEIQGVLRSELRRSFGTVLSEMLPAGSVTGAPKVRTCQIIEEAEGYERGYYTGVMGYFDGECFDSAVMIRFIERGASGLVFKSGGGITANSDARSEYLELIDKVYLPIPASPAES